MTRLHFYFGDVSEQGDVQKSVTKGWSRKESSAANPITDHNSLQRLLFALAHSFTVLRKPCVWTCEKTNSKANQLRYTDPRTCFRDAVQIVQDDKVSPFKEYFFVVSMLDYSKVKKFVANRGYFFFTERHYSSSHRNTEWQKDYALISSTF